MGTIQERYHGTPMAANTTFQITGNSIAGFLCTVAGTLTINFASNGVPGGGAAVVNALPVAAGVYYPIPLLVNQDTVVTLSGGAAGTLFR